MKRKILRNLAFCTLAIASSMITTSAFAGNEEAVTEPTLYERMGSADGLAQIVKDTIALHQKNPAISHYFDDVDLEQLAVHVIAFFAAGTGGPANYEGRDMTSTHSEMGLSVADFDSAVADVLTAVRSNVNDDDVAVEVAAILESLRPAVMGTAVMDSSGS
jgi:hemoglobin